MQLCHLTEISIFSHYVDYIVKIWIIFFFDHCIQMRTKLVSNACYRIQLVSLRLGHVLSCMYEIKNFLSHCKSFSKRIVVDQRAQCMSFFMINVEWFLLKIIQQCFFISEYWVDQINKRVSSRQNVENQCSTLIVRLHLKVSQNDQFFIRFSKADYYWLSFLHDVFEEWKFHDISQ